MQACTPVMIMLGLFVAGLEAPNWQLLLAVTFIAFGTFIASYGAVNLNPLGIVAMVASIAFEAIRLVMTQVLLVGLDCHPGTVLAALQ